MIGPAPTANEIAGVSLPKREALGLLFLYSALALLIALPDRRLVGIGAMPWSQLRIYGAHTLVMLLLCLGLITFGFRWVISIVRLTFPNCSLHRFVGLAVGAALFVGLGALTLRESIAAGPFVPAWVLHLAGFVFFCGAWTCIRAIFSVDSRTASTSPWVLSDAPITDAKYDRLNRLRRAADLASDLDRLPSESSIRMAITGGWGEGKTSFIHLLSQELASKYGHQVVWFYPWRYREYESARSGLFRTLIGAFLPSSQVNAVVQSRLLPFVQAVAKLFPGESVPALLKAVLFPSSPGSFEEAKSLLSQYLNSQSRAGKKVFLMIDDLDRAHENVIYDLLMVANELIDFSGMIAVFGLSPDSIAASLKRHHGHDVREARLFLDKILHWQIPLPVIRESTKSQFVESVLVQDGVLAADALRSLSGFLPDNPRALKMFLRILGACQPMFSRYAADDFSIKTAYVAQLIRYEFPDLLIDLAERPDDLKTLLHKTSPLGSRGDFDKKYEEVVKRIEKTYPKTDFERFHKLLTVLTEQSWIHSQAEFYLYEAHEHATLTFKEYNSVKAAALKQASPVEMVTEKIKEITAGAAYPKEALDSFLSHLIRDIKDSNGRMIEETNQGQKREFANAELLPLLEFSGRLVASSIWWKEPNRRFDSQLVMRLFGALVENSQFRREPIYKEVGEAESRILDKLLSQMSIEPDYYIYAFDPLSEGRDADQAKILKMVISGLKDALAGRMIQLIGEPSFAGSLYGTKSHWHQMVIFDAESPLYKDAQKKAALLGALSVERPTRTLHENGTSLFRRLLEGFATNPGPVGTGGARRCFTENSDVLLAALRLATKHVLDRRIVGSMEEDIKKLETDSATSEIAKKIRAALPGWWAEVVSGKPLEKASG